ncbi:MAG: AAC(3) family N-acetyltransferase [Armatimonadetes bacterium]|nr:AAC(3) family N-acetyltransferase [Armatimonadota bacterium]
MNEKPHVTDRDILSGLQRLGVRPGMSLMIHSSLSAFGHVEGGAETVARALMEAVGPEGTLIMPTFNHGAPFFEGGEGVFDPLTTRTSNGKIPDTFWRMPGVCRSLDPTHAYAAWGKNARRYTERHHLTLTMGEGSPLGLLAREGGYQLNLGTTHASSTAKHVAEMMNRSPCLGLRTEEYPVLVPGVGKRYHRTWGWRAQNCPITESGRSIEIEMERRGVQRKECIGPATVTFFKLWSFLETVWQMLDHGYEGFPPCRLCPIRPRQEETTVESDWDESRKSPVRV